MLDPTVIRVMKDVNGWFKFCLRRGLKVFMREDQLRYLSRLIVLNRPGSIMVSLHLGGELVESTIDLELQIWTIPGLDDITFINDSLCALWMEIEGQLDRLDKRIEVTIPHTLAMPAVLIFVLCLELQAFSQSNTNHHQPSAISPTVATQVAAEAKRFAKHHPGDVARIIATTQARKALFQKHAATLHVKPSLLAGIMAQECRGNDTGSLRGRYFGPMQVNRSYIRKRKLPMRSVADGYRAGADYLQRECLAQFGGHQLLALAAFNGGYPSIKRAVRWGSLPSRGGTHQSLSAVRQLAVRRPKQYRYAIGVLAKAKIIDEHNVFQAGE